ncbi:MAG: GTPase ObgE [Oscillospiraceae bacterium]
MFLDIAKIYIKAGNGGDGKVSFHREKYVAAGGPDGGDGGKGGNVYFQSDSNLNTLIDFKFKRKFLAENGVPGGQKNCSGKNGEDLIIKVPMGTLVKDAETGGLIADISDEQPYLIAKGGNGGFGNQHFATPTRQVPRFAKPGIPGQEREVVLELKLLADVGLIGFPNVGKSTLISVVSAAKPKIANYHFTTITPNLGVVKIDEGQSFVMADIPGIIEGASEGLGLGHEFLRHVDRCRLLVHIVDVSGCEDRDPIEDFNKINLELEKFSEDLSKRPQIVVANKCDLSIEEQINELKEYVQAKGFDFYEISAITTQGVEKLKFAIWQKLKELPPIKIYEPDYVIPEDQSYNDRTFNIIIDEDGVYEVNAQWIIGVFNTVDIDDYESLQYFQRVLRTSGIIDKLEEMGINEGDIVRIYNFEFEYIK